MITQNDWSRIRGYTDTVCNREADDIVFAGGRVRRMPGDDVIITLKAMELDLEPTREVEAENGNR